MENKDQMDKKGMRTRKRLVELQNCNMLIESILLDDISWHKPHLDTNWKIEYLLLFGSHW